MSIATYHFKQNTEQLVRFQCLACKGWWSIGDAPARKNWYCPWCGIYLERLEETQAPVRPVIVCLCGSTRFWRTFQQASLEETMAGRIVLSIGAASGTDDDHFGNLPKEEYDRIKEELDQLHLRKIEMADQVLILNVNGYIGESTGRELAHARSLGKQVRFWTEEHPEY